MLTKEPNCIKVTPISGSNQCPHNTSEIQDIERCRTWLPPSYYGGLVPLALVIEQPKCISKPPLLCAFKALYRLILCFPLVPEES